MIRITGAREGNLKNLSLDIPKNKLVVFTGLSGSGKSTLLNDVLFTECQRLYLEAMGMQGIRKPEVERIDGASPAVLIPQSQNSYSSNPRSTVGTVSDLYTDLRMLYEKLGVRGCPECGRTFSSADALEETKGSGDDFVVWQYCPHCGKKLDKLTRSHFSFNTAIGACPVCQGLGVRCDVRRQAAVDESLSLEEGAVRYWEKALLLEGADSPKIRDAFPQILPPKTAADGRFEGVFPILRRRLAQKEEKGQDTAALRPYFETVPCPECGGERLNAESRAVTVNAVRLPELSRLSFQQLLAWVQKLEGSLPPKHRALAEVYLTDLSTKLSRFLQAGLGYLSLDRRTSTLSGGELQRMRLAGELLNVKKGERTLYLLDEPTTGLHPEDVEHFLLLADRLADMGNSVIVVEHNRQVIAHSDWIIDLGPGGGDRGGRLMFSGTPAAFFDRQSKRE